ncbi:hypothetical protein J1N35_033814 [Gossypium stocksii]|uniref:Uncharacterized protein n=1 Tax=Gossypium stocksii TaxID=47602 RepID=A0A9D3ZPH3_9ROSI|nr:hypothetical protein J1N35_033814 [Gossypium stocksii]
MAKTRGSIKKATKSAGEHASSTTTIHESEPPRPWYVSSMPIIEFIFVREGLIPWDAANINKLYNTKVDVDKHSEFINDIIDEKYDLLQKRIVPRAGEEILENKGLINEASVERMTRGKDTSILKEAKTSKTRRGKAKIDSKRTNMNAETSLWRNLKDVEKMVNSINNRQIKLVASVEDMKTEINWWHPHPLCRSLILRKKRNPGTSMNTCQRLIAYLRMAFLLMKRTLLLRRKLVLQKKKLLQKRKLLLKNEKLLKIKMKKKAKTFVEKVVTAPESVSANIEKLERTEARLTEVVEITSDEQCNSWAIVVYTRPLQVAFPIQTIADDAGVEPETKEQFDDHLKPNKRKGSVPRIKKMKEGREENEEKETSCTLSTAMNN